MYPCLDTYDRTEPPAEVTERTRDKRRKEESKGVCEREGTKGVKGIKKKGTLHHVPEGSVKKKGWWLFVIQ